MLLYRHIRGQKCQLFQNKAIGSVAFFAQAAAAAYEDKIESQISVDSFVQEAQQQQQQQQSSDSWRQTVYEDREHVLRDESISAPAWRTLISLRTSGHEAFIVGGTIRDLLLGNTPKDFDILTSASLHQVKNLFGKCQLIGKKFPIAQVHMGGTTLEVSSWSTGSEEPEIPDDAASMRLKLDKGELGLKHLKPHLWSKSRENNALVRDFTVNALIYDPFSRLLFDYVGGISLRTQRQGGSLLASTFS
eukprot:TRINITY_DN102767_c0_g1_i1.p1 TRINITY_DN102767_c0_g1~~TRINITY_DN102767_c0_g1_i1.p1  ORF type:complete len:247 (-),score=19.95 TRINITY_DN102767_c0_g1_i1:12-752(-)